MKNYFIDQKTGRSFFHICAPLVGVTIGELAGEISLVKKYKPHFLEWRIDKINSIENTHIFLEEIRKMESTRPLIATWRTKKEGGREITFLQYQTLLTEMIQSGLVEFVDMEYSFGGKLFANLRDILKEYQVGIVGSYHNFESTPKEWEILEKFVDIMDAGAHICKVAVMPKNPKDVLDLLQAMVEFRSLYPLQPCVGIAMGKAGAISRISGGLFGSNMTFASLRETSAPGQFTVEETKKLLGYFL